MPPKSVTRKENNQFKNNKGDRRAHSNPFDYLRRDVNLSDVGNPSGSEFLFIIGLYEF